MASSDDNSVMTQQLLQYMQEGSVPSPSAWQERTLFLKEWLLLNNSLQNIPDDGMEDLIHRQIRRGDLYPETRNRCWAHLVCELREVSVVKLFEFPEPENVSPSRGKLRPGKELVVLATNEAEVVTPLQIPDSVEELATSSRGDGSQRTLTVNNRPPSIPKEKSFSNMSMMERQAEWLRKKQEKVDAEEKRQREEKEKELTFKPNLIRRQTLTDKPEEKTKPVVKQSSFNEKKSTSGLDSVGKSSSFKEPRPLPGDSNSDKRPVSRTMVEKPPSKPKTTKAVLKKKKSSGRAVDSKLEVTSHLLNSMKSELEASKAMSLDKDQGPGDDDDQQDDEEDGGDDPNDDDEEVETTLLHQAMSNDYKIDFSGMESKARIVLQDASLFELNSMYRKTDKGAGREGIALQMGRREDNHEEQVVAVIFDKDKISEGDAEKWWAEHKPRFFELQNNSFA